MDRAEKKMSLTEKILERSKTYFEDIVAIRRDIHTHPEIGFEVQRTAGIVAAELEKLGIAVKTGVGKTGVVGDIIVPGASKRIALRADMDALPMQEAGSPPYKSLLDGKAHMCGHDAHTAMLIGAARIVTDFKDELNANVRFIFQPNEENLPGGAPSMIAGGALDGVDEIFGLHVWPLVETGKFCICQGPALGQPDVFEIEIAGGGGHAAVPHKTVDPIVIASQFISAIQSIVSRNVNPLDAAVVSITEFHAGTTHNVIPQKARLTGTVRTFKKEIQRMIRNKLKNILAALTSANEAEYTFNYTEGYPVTFNHVISIEKALEAAKSIAGSGKVVYPTEPVLWGEDFAYYTEKIPGCFVFLGIRNEEKNTIYMCHDPCFDIDEDALVNGMALHAALALNYGKDKRR
jgi:amidohydrolase